MILLSVFPLMIFDISFNTVYLISVIKMYLLFEVNVDWYFVPLQFDQFDSDQINQIKDINYLIFTKVFQNLK